MPSFESPKLEKVVSMESKDELKKAIAEKNYLIDNLCDLKKPLEEYKSLISGKEAERIFLKIDRVVEKLEKVKPIKFAPANHLTHIVGQFQACAAWVERMRKAQKDNTGKGREKIKKCKEILSQVIPALSVFLDTAIKNKDFLLGELSDKNGYFKEEELKSGQKIHSLNVCEFAMLSNEYLQERESEEDVGKRMVS